MPRLKATRLATFFSRVCADLGVDPVRNWNLDQPDTWSAIGHFSVAARAQIALSSRLPRLVKLMENNAHIISHDDAAIIEGQFHGHGQGGLRSACGRPRFLLEADASPSRALRAPSKGPNHFADMDQRDDDGKTLVGSL